MHEHLGTQTRDEIGRQSVADVELMKDRTLGKILALAGDQIVEDVHVPSFGEKAVGHMRADESRPTRDDSRLHVVS